MRPFKKAVKPKFVGIRFDDVLLNKIDKLCKTLKVTRTRWIHQACQFKIEEAEYDAK